MPRTKQSSDDELTELTRTLLITQLALAGVPRKSIRAIAKCDMNRITEIMKYLKAKSKTSKKSKEEH